MAENSEMTFEEAWESLNNLQKKFVLKMQECGSKVDAAKELGIKARTTYKWPNTVNYCIDHLIDHQLDALRSDIRNLAMNALNQMPELIDSDDEHIKLQAAKYLIDHTIGKATQHQTVEQESVESINISIKGDD